MRKSSMLFIATFAAGCGAHIGEVRIGSPHPARPVDCNLEFVTMQAIDTEPGSKFGPNGDLEKVGTVLIAAKKDIDPMSNNTHLLVRPRACRMGGEVVSLLATDNSVSNNGKPQENILYTVWGRRQTVIVQPAQSASASDQ